MFNSWQNSFCPFNFTENNLYLLFNQEILQPNDMKKTLLFAFALFSFALQAQLTVDVTTVTDAFEYEDEGASDISGYATITNEGATTTNFTWLRSNVEKPSKWETAVCIDDLCFSTGQDSFNFDLESGATAQIILHAYPGGSAFSPKEELKLGTGTADISVTQTDNPDNTITVSYSLTLNGDPTVDTDEVAAAKEVKMFPNPASEYFTISANDVVDQVIVYNIIGRKVKTFNANDSDRYDVANLPNGMYLVSLVNTEQGVLRTMRLSKRTLRP